MKFAGELQSWLPWRMNVVIVTLAFAIAYGIEQILPCVIFSYILTLIFPDDENQGRVA